MNPARINAARQRVEAASFKDAMNMGRELIARLRIPHTKTLRQVGGIQFTWNWMQTRLTAKYISYILRKLGFSPVNSGEAAAHQDEFTNGSYNVLVSPGYGVLVIRPAGKEPLRASVNAGVEPTEIHEYDDYEEWKKAVSEFSDVEFFMDHGVEYAKSPDLPDDHVGAWTGRNEGGWAWAKPGILSSVTDPSDADSFTEFDDYEEWLAAAKSRFPKARHNKKGLPGYVPGYGEEDDEEFVVGPDMQADVVAVWVADDDFGWILRS